MLSREARQGRASTEFPVVECEPMAAAPALEITHAPEQDERPIMPLRAIRTLAVCAAVATATLAAPSEALAQSFFSFLWDGGSREETTISPSLQPRQIIVSFSDRKLYWVYQRGKAISYPIAVPREKSRWAGATHISQKRVNPDWTPTETMRRENPKLPLHVPGGHPRNPLGVRAMYLGSSMYRIHGTDAPWTIGDAASKGCIRMYNEDVVDLYGRVPVGTRVLVTYQRYR